MNLVSIASYAASKNEASQFICCPSTISIVRITVNSSGTWIKMVGQDPTQIKAKDREAIKQEMWDWLNANGVQEIQFG